MKEQEKQIEEIASYMRLTEPENLDGYVEERCSACHYYDRSKCTDKNCYEVIKHRLCDLENSIEDGKLKFVSKDSVVLSKEEYEKYQNLKRDVEYSFEYNQGYTDGQIKGSKETAEKLHYHITTTLLALWKGNKITTEIYNSWMSFFNGLAKYYGVEIKE